MEKPERTLRVYIHLPFCFSKCSYCHFYSLPLKLFSDPLKVYMNFLEILIRELDWWIERYSLGDRRLLSIYLGGGTPSLIPPELVGSLISEVKRRFHGEPLEITLEANPEDLDYFKALNYRALGITRLSIGVQTFNLFGLRLLGRRYSPEEALRAIWSALESGLKVNIDLIYGYPFQKMESLLRDLEIASNLPIHHISIYELEEEGSRLATWELERGQELIEEMSLTIHQVLKETDFRRYEVSNYARAGNQSVHNLGYWLYEDWIGLGPSAASKITLDEGVIRYRVPPNLRYYLSEHLRVLEEKRVGESLKPSEVLWEKLVMGLRLVEGIPLERFSSWEVSLLSLALEPLVRAGKLLLSAGRLRVREDLIDNLHLILLEIEERIIEFLER